MQSWHSVRAEHSLPPRLVTILECVQAHFTYLSEQVGAIEKDIGRQIAEDDLGQRLLSIPGVVPIRASVLAAEMGDGKQCGCSRDFAASAEFGTTPVQQRRQGQTAWDK